MTRTFYNIYCVKRLTLRGFRTEWRWTLVASNGHKLASGESFKNYTDLINSILLVKESGPSPLRGGRPS